ncbi:MAG: type II methionyl aminopeptidase [Promethearchaeota archaeon]
MDEDILGKYMKAGKINAEAADLGVSLVEPGASILEIGEKIENYITSKGVKLSFPVNLSVDNCAAHYSPAMDDLSVLPDQGILKIDVGAHVDGYISDHAVSVDIGNTGGMFRKLIESSEEALKVAIKNFKPGNHVHKVGAEIEKVINKHGFKPIRNLGGHSLEQYVLHSGVFVPNIGTGEIYKLKNGDAFAIEPFSTNGDGYVVDGSEQYIYRFVKRPKKQVNSQMKNFIETIRKNFSSLPFSLRWLLHKFSREFIRRSIEKFLYMGSIHGYKLLMERGKGFVSQSEHTVVIVDGEPIVTTMV